MVTTEIDVYTITIDEDVQPISNHCPECNGRVTTNAAETVCDDCGLVIDAASEWQNQSGVDRDRCIPPAARETVSVDE